MKVFVSMPLGDIRRSFVTEEVEAYLEERFEVTYNTLSRQLTREELREVVMQNEVLVTGWGHQALDGALVENSLLKLIVHTGGSVGSLVNHEVYENGIKVISGNELYADSVAEGVVAYMLSALRMIPDYVYRIKNGGWDLEDNYTEGLLEQTVGLVGYGAISQKVAKLLQPFRVKIKMYSSYPIPQDFLDECHVESVSLEEIFSTCKIVSLHSAMNERTRGMIGKEHFILLKPGAIFVNTARGKIIREEEMIDALKQKRFKAILDVYSQEPIAQDSELRKLENVYCVPHKAGPTVDRRPIITKCLADDIKRFEQGKEMKYEISKEYAARMTVGG